MTGGEYNNQRHATALKRKRVVELRDQGFTFKEISDDIGFSKAAAWQHYQAAMREIPAEAIAAHQETLTKRLHEQLNRIDMEREAAVEVLANRHVTVSQGRVVFMDEDEPIIDDTFVLQAIDRLIKLDDQEAKLLGLYAEKKVNLAGDVKYEIVGVDPADLT